MSLHLIKMFEISKRKWGLTSQILMLVEELNELGVASLHLLRANKPRDETLENFAEEIADVEFMLEEMKYYFQNDHLIAEYRRKKEKRLEKLLKEEG